MMRLIIGMSGASGVIYGIRLLEVLHGVADVETHLVMSDSAKLNIAIEADRNAKDVQALADEVYSNKDIAARLASGSFRTDGMIVAPCAMKTLSAIANSYADSLLVRAADVVLKERRRLVLMPRETPLHTGHCELLYKASQIGAIIAPPMPAHYINPQSVDDLVDHHVGRILDLFDLDPGLVKRWQGPSSRQ
ncbi:MAG TPA: 3-octaprenyl-4-hydroxybenzoate carboxy-lyase [Gammaproteobacteria bacterium]|uniref:Flavin prenyltransferase UbiX n=1 Tax=OM182 bacterium TaxID=2510334 RepID=A0A520S2F0_9GAMM|nr:3-octaprenyl-4-hydroxybenzoate carboxy-lyase [Gammaproteobacteria bacterium]RPG43611.1 MAG: UbiX family flavin prenyltransferase [Gammaproteobacteria bacterium TMED163]RZO76629.1 MAG: UbiX family flavin prenyltransferase [OM182 bacterium]MAV54295.1 3-octaprenyl-4-hydroxybenzoate carboxy-lyase [Gammaproteobacteria bacterium]HAR90751.1 3-octaprenyl-4-hydroxybenzoate carboxy-lyase [Gammaproteobacteria bacterium]